MHGKADLLPAGQTRPAAIVPDQSAVHFHQARHPLPEWRRGDQLGGGELVRFRAVQRLRQVQDALTDPRGRTIRRQGCQ